MILYSYSFKPNGKITNIPDSQSFFGAICHTYGRVYGEEELVKMLERNQKEDPDFIVSSFFVKGFLPVPLDLNIPFSNRRLSKEQQSELKIVKKIKYFSKQIFKEYLNDSHSFTQNYHDNILNRNYLIIDKLYLIKKEEKSTFSIPFFNETMEIRNLVGRDDIEKQLFYNEVIYCNDELEFEVYIKYKNEEIHQKLLRVLKEMIYVSIGGGKSIGLNLFTFTNEHEEIFDNHNGNKILLSKAIGDESIDYSNSFYQLLMLNSKFNYAKELKFKKKTLVFSEGSSLHTNKDYVGKIIVESINSEAKYTNLIGFLI